MFEKRNNNESEPSSKKLSERLTEKYGVDSENFESEGYIGEQFSTALKLEGVNSFFNEKYLDLLDDPDIESVFRKVGELNKQSEWVDPEQSTLEDLDIHDRGLNKSGASSIGISIRSNGTVTFSVTR